MMMVVLMSVLVMMLVLMVMFMLAAFILVMMVMFVYHIAYFLISAAKVHPHPCNPVAKYATGLFLMEQYILNFLLSLTSKGHLNRIYE